MHKQVTVLNNKICLEDSLIDWNSIKISSNNALLHKEIDYSFLDSTFCIFFKTNYQKIDIEYRLLSVTHLDSFYHKDRRKILLQDKDGFNAATNFNKEKESDPYNLFAGSKLNAYGNMSRGLGFGNNQNLVVNSNLNLQLSGDLGNDIELVAAISDESNPIQPEGNTQQLQDFDWVYFKFIKKQNSLTLGDFLLENNSQNHFLKYNKRSRGISYAGGTNYNGGDLNIKAAAAVSRGRFSKNVINGVEGNQGPYQLRGTNNEIFILILAGTEKIYLDGKLLTRGENNDYVINYNLGEITFTVNSIITSFSRIVAEFQYSDRNYSRTMTSMETEYTKKRWSFRGGYFLEQDNKNQPFQQSLEAYDSLRNLSAKQILKMAGDNPSLATMQSFQEGSSFNYERVNYRRVDTLGRDSVFIYAPSPFNNTADTTTYFQVRFSFVGKGNGDYTPTISSANGRVYKYVPPVAGRSVGDYDAIVLLVSPVQQQLLTVASTYTSKKGFVLDMELAGSVLDKNTFSKLDAGDNQGWAGSISAKNTKKLPKLDSFTNLYTTIKFEHKNKDFNFVERYRPVEFQRQWNRELGNPNEQLLLSDEEVFFMENRFVQREKLNIGSKLYSFLRKDNFTGISHELTFMRSWKSVEISGLQGITRSNSEIGFKEKNNFEDYGLEVAKYFNKLKWGVGVNEQSSKFSYDSSSNMGIKSYAFNNKYSYINLPFKETNLVEIRGELRKDKRPLLDGLQDASLSKNLSLKFVNNSSLKNKLELDLTYRAYEVLDSTNFPGESEDNLLSKLQYSFKWFKNSLSGNTFLNVGTGREQKREYTYLEVQAGNGFYTWNDYNNNGIKELNEFEEAVFQDKANYIRIITPTNEFIKSNTNEFNQTLKIQAPKKWSNGLGIEKFFFRFSTNSAWRIARKNTEDDFFALVNPFENNIESSSLIYTKSLVKHTVFFNRLSSKYSIEYTTVLNKDKIFINNGFDSRNENINKFKVRVNLSSKISILNELTIGEKGFGSDFFESRNYLYDYLEIVPSLNWVFNRNFRSTLSYKHYNAQNRPSFGLEKTENKEVALQVVYNALQKGNIDATLSYIDVNYDGIEGNSLSFDMLKGLSNGRNLKWVVGAGKRFSNHMLVRIEYNARQIGANPIIHVGNVQARYLF